MSPYAIDPFWRQNSKSKGTFKMFPEKYCCCMLKKLKTIINGREYIKQDRNVLKEKTENPILDFSQFTLSGKKNSFDPRAIKVANVPFFSVCQFATLTIFKILLVNGLLDDNNLLLTSVIEYQVEPTFILNIYNCKYLFETFQHSTHFMLFLLIPLFTLQNYYC